MKRIPAIILYLLLFAACACNSPRYIYSPSPANMPFIKDKGDSKLAAYLSGGSSRTATPNINARNIGFDLQGAYAISKNWAITASYFNRRERDGYIDFNNSLFDSSVVDYSRNILDVGAGLFTAGNSQKTMFLSLYAGIGAGSFSFNDKGKDAQQALYSRYHKNSIIKWYLQPSLYTIGNGFLSAAFLSRFSFIHYADKRTTYNATELSFYNLDKLHNRTVIVFEPALILQARFPDNDWLKIEGNLSLSTDPFSNKSNLEARNMNASIGLVFDLSKVKK